MGYNPTIITTVKLVDFMPRHSALLANLLRWPIEKNTRVFRVYVVQPQLYEPLQHPAIFDACLRLMVTEDENGEEVFDLISFPEAFITSTILLSVISSLATVNFDCCIHVGLRATDEKRHLFNVAELKKLVTALQGFGDKAKEDLLVVHEWANSLKGNEYINLACLFRLDAYGHLRICLHPKLLRSKFERSPFPEQDMHEARLHSLVTLIPEDRTLLPIVIHPLICSDGLRDQNDCRDPRPLEILTVSANEFGERLPDHVDIVSMCTATPQQIMDKESNPPVLHWHQEFRASFVAAASDDNCNRHQYAVFVLSNFGEINNVTSGLSGAFVPVGVSKNEFPSFVNTISYGHPNEGDVGWAPPRVHADRGRKAYMTTVEQPVVSCVAQIFGFTIPRLLRDMTRWKSSHDLSNLVLYRSEYDLISGQLVFKRV